MRLILGIIIGGALTIGGAYVADKTAGAQPMVNWDVVGKNVSNLTGMARDGWKKITGWRKLSRLHPTSSKAAMPARRAYADAPHGRAVARMLRLRLVIDSRRG
jgi:hypothetical protein